MGQNTARKSDFPVDLNLKAFESKDSKFDTNLNFLYDPFVGDNSVFLTNLEVR